MDKIRSTEMYLVWLRPFKKRKCLCPLREKATDMKILFQHDGFMGNGNFPERLGLINVFRALGHEVVDWDFKNINAFDAFTLAEQGSPIDLFIGQTYNCNKAVARNIEMRPYMRVAMQCSTWGDVLKNIDLEKYPILVPTEDEKRIIGNLFESCQRPSLVYQNYAPDRVDDCLNGWTSLGVKPVSNLNAADYFVYNRGTAKREFECDVAYVGGRWPYKGSNIDKVILPLLNEKTAPRIKNRKVSVHVYGNQGWQGIAQYRGLAADTDVKDIFASAVCCPNVSEPHSNLWGFDVVARPFKVALAGGLPILDNVQSLIDCYMKIGDGKRELYLPDYDTYEDLVGQIQFFIERPDIREGFIKGGYAHTLRNHTYFNRVMDLFDHLGMIKESDYCFDLHKDIIEKETASL